MKTFTKAFISFVVGIAFIVIGISMDGIENLSIPTIPSIQFGASRISDMQFTNTEDNQTLQLNLTNADIVLRESRKENIEIEAKQIYNNFKIYNKNNCIVIDQPRYFFNKRKAKIYIYVPKDTSLQQIKVNVGAGAVRINELNAQNIELETGAGSLKVDKMETNKLSVKTGMGDTNLKQVSCDQLAVDLGMGNVKVGLQNKIEEYGYNVSVGLGNVKLGDNKFSGIAQDKSYYQTKDKRIDIECGMGNVNISEMEEE